MLGHIVASRSLNIGIEVASFGIGPKLFQLWRSKLLMRIPLIYCEKVVFESTTGALSKGVDALHSRPNNFWRKTVVLAAGPFVSFFIAASIFVFLSAAGTSVYLPIIGEVHSGSPAEKSGLKPSDRILSVDNRPVSSWGEMAGIIANSPAPLLLLKVQRGGEVFAINVEPEIITIQNLMGESEQRRVVGIMAAGIVEVQKPPIWRLPLIGIVKAGAEVRFTAKELFSAGTGQTKQTTLGGPIGIKKSATENIGIIRLVLIYVASLAANISFLALLPLPIFDGGQFVYLVVETIRGKQISSDLKRRLRLFSIILLLAFATLVILLNFVDLLLM
jgi:regulator of sigma E protease